MSHEQDSDLERTDPKSSKEPALYFFPEDEITERELREILEDGPAERRAWALSHLLRFAQWDDIWQYVSRDELRQEFDTIELPENLRTAWARMLKIDSAVPVG